MGFGLQLAPPLRVLFSSSSRVGIRCCYKIWRKRVINIKGKYTKGSLNGYTLSPRMSTVQTQGFGSPTSSIHEKPDGALYAARNGYPLETCLLAQALHLKPSSRTSLRLAVLKSVPSDDGTLADVVALFLHPGVRI